MKQLREKNYKAVYTQCLALLRQDEKNPLAFFLLGVLASDTGSHAKALELFAKAVEHAPDNLHYQTYFAKSLAAHNQSALAKQHADKAARIFRQGGTKDALLSDMIGVVYSRTGHHDLAIPFFEQAVKTNPKWANFHFNLGASAEFIGDFNKAKTAYANAVSTAPKFYQAWFALTALDKQTPDDNRLEDLKTLFESVSGDAEAQLLLGHSIAKTLEDLGQHADSFKWLEKAKQAKKQQDPYNRQEIERVFAVAKQSAPEPQSSPNKNAPIFIVGLPRTGTTLLDRILSSHKDVTSAGELNLFNHLLKQICGSTSPKVFDTGTMRAAQNVDLAELGSAYIENTRTLANGAAHMIDKTQLNFLYASLIHQALPNAKIITLRRGALDSCLSNYRQLFATHNRDYDYTYDLENTAHFYGEFDALTAHWRETLPADNFTEIYYEDIVHDQENQTRRLLEFCGLDWDVACLNFHENTAPVDTASAVQVRQPLYAGSIGRWKKYGNKLDGLKAALGDLVGD